MKSFAISMFAAGVSRGGIHNCELFIFLMNINLYFNAFKQISALDWTRDMQLEICGKCAITLSLQESLDYCVLKDAILRVYELVSGAYRQT